MKLLPLEAEQPWTPQRLVQAQPHHILSWTFRQRTVFALVDGRRDTMQIACMLSISPYKVRQVLYDLQQKSVIAKERPRHE